MYSLILYLVIVIVVFGLLQGALLLTADVRDEARIAAGQLRLRRPVLADGLSPWLSDILLTAPIRSFDKLVQTCGINAKTENVLLGMMIVTSTTAVVVHLSRFASFALVAGGVLGICLPLLILIKMRTMRMNKLVQQLPETLDTMVRSLRAGHPIPTCIALVASDMPVPTAPEFKRIHDAMAYGLNLRDALERMTERLHTVRELKYVAAAIRIQSVTGGNLSEILAGLSQLMRERNKLNMKVKALSAEGRLSGNILAAVPVGVTLAIRFIRPDFYVNATWGSGLLDVLGFAAALVAGGYLIIRRISNIRV